MLEGRFGEAELYMRQSAAGARSLGDRERAVRVELDLARVLVETRAPIASANLLHGLEGAPLTPAQRAIWHVLMGHVLRGFSQYELAEVHFRHAARAGEELRDDPFSGYALVERGALRSVLGSTRDAIGFYEKGISILRDTRPRATHIGSISLAANCIHLGDTGRALRELDRVSSELGGSPSGLDAAVDLHLAEIAILDGDGDLARTLCDQVERSVMRSGQEVHRPHVFVLRAILDDASSPETVLQDLASTAERLWAEGLFQDSGMLRSVAAIHAEWHGLAHASHLARSREILRDVGAAEEFDAHHRRLYEARGPRRRRPVGLPPGIEPRASSPSAADPVQALAGGGLVLLLSPDERLAHRLESALTPGRRVSIVRRWPRFRALAATADCGVVVQASLAHPPDRRRIADLKRALPWLPLVVVTEREAENARHLAGLEVDEVVWVSSPATVAAAVGGASSKTVLRWLARTFGAARGIDPVLREALVQLCASPHPLTSVTDLADSVGRNRASLAKAWRREAGETPWRLQDVVAWVILLRALGLKSPDRSWSEVAYDVGVHVQTLRSYADRIAGEGLGRLDPDGRRRVARRFVDEIVDPLLGPR